MNQVNADKNLGAAVEDLKTERGFTPGPWQVLRGDRCWHVASMDRTFETGCIMFAGGEGSDEANARLIAAAPALYEALENLYGDLYLLGMKEITLEQIYSGSFKEALTALMLARNESAKRPIDVELTGRRLKRR